MRQYSVELLLHAVQ